ncbi:MAG: hypothetical protein K1X79_14390 [Oligoflexia bacterium]|nr:hypothetical protein [Oligoflexia bacterium]
MGNGAGIEEVREGPAGVDLATAVMTPERHPEPARATRDDTLHTVSGRMSEVALDSARRDAVSGSRESHVDPAKLNAEVEALAQKTAQSGVPIDQLQARIGAEIAQLRREHSGNLSSQQFEALGQQYLAAFSAERERMMMAEVAQVANQAATRDFDKDHSSGPTKGEKNALLSAIAEKYADVYTTEFGEKMDAAYKSAYQTQRTELAETKLSWLERKWNSITSWAGDLWDSFKESGFGKFVVAAAPIVGGLLKEAALGLVDKAVSAVKNAGEFALAVVSDPAKALSMIKNGLTTVWDVTCKVADAVGVGKVVSGLYNFGVELSHGNVREAFKALGQAALGAAQAATVFFATTPIGLAISGGFALYQAVQAVSAFAHGDVIGGVAHSVGAIFSALPVLSRGLSALRGTENALSTTAKQGLEKLADSVSKDALNNVVKDTVENMAKQSLTDAGKEITEEAVKAATQQILEKAGVESLEGLSREGAEAVLKVTLDKFGAKAAENAAMAFEKEAASLSGEALKALQSDIARQAQMMELHALRETEKTVADLVRNPVKDATKSMVDRVQRGNIKELAEELGIDKAAVKELKQFLANGKADQEIIAAIEKSAVKNLSEPIANGLRPGFERAMQSKSVELAERFGLEAAALKKGAMDGFERGVLEGVARGAREGAKQGLNESRMRAKNYGSGEFGSHRAVEETNLAIRDSGLKFGELDVQGQKVAGGTKRFGYKRLEEAPIEAEKEVTLRVVRGGGEEEVSRGNILMGPGSEKRAAEQRKIA